ncbi:MAG: EamA family transporter [Pseudomonadota bacterium]
MSAWVLITIAAAFLQNARSALQKHLRGRLSGAGATYVRFVYGAPYALAFAAVATALHGGGPAAPEGWAPVFWSATTAGGVAQILATFALIRSFDYTSFAVGTALSKTEPIQAALFGALLLAEIPSWGVIGAIGLGVLGVALATVSPRATGRLALSPQAAAWGLGSAALFAISAVSYRAASLSLGDDPAWLRATCTLAAATVLQTLIMGAWMRWRSRGDLAAVWAAWRPGLLVGAAGAAASACWFTAFTLEPAAHVRTLANIELVFTFAASVLVFRERPTLREVVGVLLTMAGVTLLLVATL